MYTMINFPKILDPRGNLTFIEYPKQIPFEIKRIFYTYGVPGGQIRGGHAYKSQEEIIIALSGSFDVMITNKLGKTEKIQLNRSYHGVYLSPNVWRHMENFSTNALSLHISSALFDELDYIRDYKVFLNE